MIKIHYGQSPLLFINFIILFYSLGVYMTMKPPEISKSYTHLFYLIIVNLILAFFFTLRKHKLTFLLYLILFFFLGVMRYLSFTFIADDNIKNYDNQEITLTGIICQMPKIRQDSAGIYHLTYVVDTKSIKQKEEKTTTGKVYLYQKQKNLDNLAKINDTISATGTIRLIQNYHNPNLVDRELSAQEEGIYATFSIGKQNLKILNTSDKFSLQEFCYQIEQSFLQSMYQVMPENDANMIFAMLFGGYNNIEKDILEAYSITGIIHILSVSGSHISLISLFLLSLGKFLHLPRFFNLILLLILIIFYTILCGASIPVIRASIMGLLSIIALYLEEKSTAQHLLSIIALILLLFDPLLLFNISFQLSFASTAGLVYLMPILRSNLNKLKLPPLLTDNLALTMSAQILAFPIIIWYFTSLSLSSLLANLIIIPLLEILIILGLIAFILGFIFPFITKILFIFASLILSISNEATFLLTKIPFASIYVPPLNFPAILIYYSLIFIILNIKIRRYLYSLLQKYKFITYICSISLIICSCYLMIKPSPLQIHFIDVGQGDACLIITPHQHSILIDTGGSINSDFDIGSYVDLPYLRHYGINKLDYLILSHADTDHSGGASSILQKIPVNHLIIADEDKDLYAKILKLPLNNPLLARAIVAKENTAFNLEDIHFQFLQNDEKENLKSSNDSSNVLKLTYHNFSVLFTGDLPQTQEKYLLNKNIASTILKVAHHGSKTSSSQEFLEHVRPQLAIISVGKYNSFGHPSKEVLDRLNNLPTKILRTDEKGAIVIYTDGYNYSLKTFLN